MSEHQNILLAIRICRQNKQDSASINYVKCHKSGTMMLQFFGNYTILMMTFLNVSISGVMYKTCNRTRPNRTYGNYRTYPTEPTGITERSGPNLRKMAICRYWNLASIPVVGKIKDRCMEERFLYINARST